MANQCKQRPIRFPRSVRLKEQPRNAVKERRVQRTWCTGVRVSTNSSVTRQMQNTDVVDGPFTLLGNGTVSYFLSSSMTPVTVEYVILDFNLSIGGIDRLTFSPQMCYQLEMLNGPAWPGIGL